MAGAASLVLCGLTPTHATADPAAESPAADELTLSAEQEASALARQVGFRVEVEELTTETSRTVANSNGTFTVESSAVPVRVERGADWVPIDTDLVAVDGSYTSVAAVTDVRFSAGGTGPLVVIERNGVEASWTWPAPLPEPKVDGATATYDDVMPGVDLRVVAEREGFSHALVVEDAAAAQNPALAAVALLTDVQGGQLQVRPDQGVDVVADDGEVIFASPTPVMWDSSATGIADPGARR